MADKPTGAASADAGAAPTAADLAKQKKQEETALREKLEQETHRREEVLEADTKILFEKLSAYLNGELQTTIDDFKLLEAMNKVTKDRYTDMTSLAVGLVKNMKDLQDKYAKYQPYLAKIDEIDASLAELERTVSVLDEYTQKLENKFKYLKEAKKLPYNKATPPSSV